jgi:hypothetical protein
MTTFEYDRAKQAVAEVELICDALKSKFGWTVIPAEETRLLATMAAILYAGKDLAWRMPVILTK